MKKDIKDYSPEVWKEIEGTSGLYLISNWGKVKRRQKRGFDLFNLIPEGLALDKTTIK